MITLRNKALNDFKAKKQMEKWNYYQKLRNLVTKTVKLEKIAFFKYLFTGNSKQEMWKHLKHHNIVKTKRREIPESLCSPDSFNDFLLSNTPKIQVKLSDIERLYPKNIKLYNKFSFTKIDDNDIRNSLSKISSKMAGRDNIDIGMLTLCTPHIIPQLVHIINKCIDESYFPHLWKIAKIIPIPKKPHTNLINDLRPISILPTMSKVLERILYNQIYQYSELQNILPLTQSGFRKGHSCTTALLKIVDDVRYHQDRSMDTALIALDFTKAFDSLDPNILQAILRDWGFSKSALMLIESYLHDRMQFVYINGQHSAMKSNNMGVPQGSILGPLLFTLYTSRINDSIKSCRTHMYADDIQI